MNSIQPTPITLDRVRLIAYTNRTQYRLACLPQPFAFEDLQKPKKSYGALCAWLWACLVPADAVDFATPEELSVHVPPNLAALNQFARLLCDAINAAGDTEKNGKGSTAEPSHSPSSS